jgi:hypothetical protein
MVEVKIDGKAVELLEGNSAKDLAIQLKLNGPDQALGARINGVDRDLAHPFGRWG